MAEERTQFSLHFLFVLFIYKLFFLLVVFVGFGRFLESHRLSHPVDGRRVRQLLHP